MTRSRWLRSDAPRLRTAVLNALGERLQNSRLAPQVDSCEEGIGYTAERVSFNVAKDLRIPALFLRPAVHEKAPAILYCHSHGHDYTRGKEEILAGKGRMPAIGPLLARAGYCVLAVDAWCFGERQADENATAKRFLLEGKTLWGMMLSDERVALDYLEARKEVDPTRIGCFGFSMGSTKAWWIGALDPRIRAVVAACGLTTYRALIDADGLNRHALYYYVPGILKVTDVGGIVSLVAPRPLLSLCGEDDVLSPLLGVRAVHRQAGKIYNLFGARSSLVDRRYKAGHEFTDEMLDHTLSWFGRHLNNSKATLA